MIRWFFYTGDDDVVHLRARLEGAGRVAHAYHDMNADDVDFHGIPYDMLRDARNGIIEIDTDGNAAVKSATE